MPQVQSPTLSIESIFQGGYEILSELGTGSFGRVYKARQLSTGQQVAIKILHFRRGDTSADVKNQIERFRREMRLCAELSHPNIVRLIDSGESDSGILYAVFEFVPGANLKEVLAAEGKLSARETLHLMTQVLDALSCAHARGVVHRDLKPENIMVTKTGARRNALVLDLGLGGFAREAQNWELPRLTATQEMMGTPCYAAPEQLRGEPPSTRSDLYSWGLIFLECLTGELAVSGGSGQEVILKQLGPDPIPIPQWLRHQRLGRLLATVTAKQVEKRDVTVEGLLQVLDGLPPRELLSQPDSTKPESLPEGERRQLTVVCCRLVVSSLDRKQLDVEELDQLLHAQHASFAECAARHGGHVASVLADRILLVFGYPQAREDDARGAARTALQIAADVARWSGRSESERRIHLQVKVGIHTGLVIVRELRQVTQQGLFDVVGLTPQIATRLEELARPGEILVSFDTRRLLRNEISSQLAGEHQLGDFSATASVFRLTAEQRTGGALETIPPGRETPLIGRTQEFSQLLASWTQTQAGQSGTVLISGEAGIGKSRLVRELRRRVPADAWLECRCVAENQASPLRPVVDLLMMVSESLESLLTRYGFDVAETYPLFAALLSLPLNGRYAPLPLSAERQKQLTLTAILSLLLKMAEERPRVLAFEDLHWADPTTLELAALLVQEVGTAEVLDTEAGPRLRLLFTARSEFTPPWSMDHMTMIRLPRLTRQDVEEMVTAGLTEDKSLPGAVLEQVVRRADGVPLFVEEVTRMLVESGMLSPQLDRITVDGPSPQIPTTLRDLLSARLDGLSAGARDTAQLAAVLGREFRYELLSAVSGKAEPSLRENVNELVKTGLVYHRRSIRPESYVFKHGLLCDAAYESMVKARRQLVHQRVASVLRLRFPDIEQHRPEVLALHFERGGELQAAAESWHRAGQLALERAAYVEAVQQLERGLKVLQTVQESAQRTRTEIELLTTFGTVLFMTKGYAAEEVEQTFARAWELCERLGEEIPLKILYGIWAVQITRGDREAVDKLLPRLRPLAMRAEDPVSALAGHSILGVSAFWRGNFVEADEHVAQGKQFYGTDAFEQFTREYGYDGGLYLHAFGMCIRWQLGYPDQAETLRQELLSIAERSRNPYSMSLALAFGMTVSLDRGDVESTLEMSDRLTALATEQHLYLWLAPATCERGGALLQRGDPEAAVSVIQQGLGLYRGFGVLSSYAYYLTYLAAAHLAAGQVTEGLAVVEEGLSLCETLVPRFHEPELLRLKGDLLFLQKDDGGAETWFLRALDVAQRQRAKSYELRAAVSLSRLLLAQGKRDQARLLLGSAYGWFTEGFDTRDLRTAQGLIAQLS